MKNVATMIKLKGMMDTYYFDANLGSKRGNMSRVFQGFRKSNPEKKVAIKVLFKDLAERRMYKARFKRESDIQLYHRNVLEVYEYIFQNNNHHIVMEWLDGETLDHIIEHRARNNEPFSLDEALFIIRQVLEGLTALHSEYEIIIHRDIKPANLMQCRNGLIKILDFGIAKKGETPADQRRLTGVATFLGTLVYAAPEQLQVQNHKIGPWTDLWAVGITLYELLTFKLPFDGETDEETRAAILEKPLPKPPNLDIKIYKLLLKATQKKPEERYQSAEDFIKEIDELLSPVETEPFPWATIISIGVSIILLILFLMLII